MNNIKSTDCTNITTPFGWKGALTITSVLPTLSKPFLALQVLLSVCFFPSVFSLSVWIYHFSSIISQPTGLHEKKKREAATLVRMPLTEIWSWHWSCFMFWQLLSLFSGLISIFMRDRVMSEWGGGGQTHDVLLFLFCSAACAYWGRTTLVQLQIQCLCSDAPLCSGDFSHSFTLGLLENQRKGWINLKILSFSSCSSDWFQVYLSL